MSQVPCPREVGRPWGGVPRGLLKALRVPFGFQLMAWKEGEGELVLPLAQCPSAFLYCLLLLGHGRPLHQGLLPDSQRSGGN